MKIELLNSIKEIQKFSIEMKGVFYVKDLEVILNCKNKATFFNRIKLLTETKILQKFTKGIYIIENFNPEALSTRIDENSYISMGTVLAKNGLIGTNPAKLITAVRVGRNRTYSSSDLEIKHYGILEDLYFGFTKINGINIADNEKALLDTMYYKMKGNKTVFNLKTDIDFNLINKERYFKYLEKYKNKRFIKFCEGIFQ